MTSFGTLTSLESDYVQHFENVRTAAERARELWRKDKANVAGIKERLAAARLEESRASSKSQEIFKLYDRFVFASHAGLLGIAKNYYKKNGRGALVLERESIFRWDRGEEIGSLAPLYVTTFEDLECEKTILHYDPETSFVVVFVSAAPADAGGSGWMRLPEGPVTIRTYGPPLPG